MMGTLGDEFTRVVLAGAPREKEPAPGDVFSSPVSNADIARMMHGIEPGGKLPRAGTAKRRAYESDLRRVQRYRAPEGRQQRGKSRPDPKFVKRVKRLADPRKRAAKILRRGITATIRATIKVSQVWRVHTMPAGDALTIDGDALGPAVDAWTAGNEPDSELAAAFFDAYGIPGTEMGEVEWATFTIR